VLSAGTPAALRDFKEYKEYLVQERKRVSCDILKMTDGEAFKDLKSAMGDLQKGIENFNKNMQPLTDILNAVAGLRQPASGAPSIAEVPAPLVFDGALDHRISVRQPLSLKTHYVMY
jgi:hypothetical protein